MDIQKFKDICDSSLSDAGGVFGCESYESMYQEIREACGKYSDGVVGTAQRLAKFLTIESILNDFPSQPYLNVLTTLIDALRASEPSVAKDYSEELVEWDDLVSAVFRCASNLHYFNKEEKFDERLVDLACALGRLTKFGVKYECLDNGVFLSSDSNEIIRDRIDSLCRKIGGKRLLSEMFSFLEPSFNAEIGRYLIFRKVSMGLESVSPAYPWGYYLALGVKHLGDSGVDDCLDDLRELSVFVRDLITVWEIQPYSVWEGIFVRDSAYLEFLRAGVLYDGLVNFSQVSGRHARSIINGLCGPFVDARHESYGVKLSLAKKVSLSLIELSLQKKPRFVTWLDISRCSGLSRHEVEKAMRLLAHQPCAANKDFSYPPFNENIDSNFKPSFFVGAKYYLLPRCLTAVGAINALLNMISRPNGKFDSNLDNALGVVFERYIRRMLQEKGVENATGNFLATDGGDSGECDIVVQGDNKIFLIEVKKKALTRRAMSGIDYELLNDISDSLLHSHAQAMKAECQLQRTAGLNLKGPEGRDASIKLQGREIERVSLSLYDFGSLQDRATLQVVLKLAVGIRFKSEHPDAESAIKKWHEHIEDIYRYGLELGEFSSGTKMPFSNSSFMSLPQLLTMLEGCKSVSEFESFMTEGKYVVRGTRDFYAEHVGNLAMRRYRLAQVALPNT